MKKFFLVATAIYLLFLALVGAIFAIFGYIGMNVKPESIPATFNPIFPLIMTLLFVGWLVATGIGLLLKRHWARYSIMVMSVFAIFIGIIFCLIFSITPLPGDATTLRTVFIVLAIIFLITLPVIYLIFFTRQSVKELFGTKKLDLASSNRPVGISILATFYFISGLISLLMALFPMNQSMPICGGIWLSGIYLKIYMFIISFIMLYLGYGFWKLQKAAWVTYIIFGCSGLIIGVVNLFTFDMTVLNKMMAAGYTDIFSVDPVFFRIFTALGLLFSLAILVYVFCKKGLFFKDKAGSETQLSAEG